MTNEEAKKIRSAFNNGFEYPFGGGSIHACNIGEVNRHAKLLNEALEKQIPKKPIEKAQTGFDFEVAHSLVCPYCNAPIVNVWSKSEYNPRFCHYCGQKLDWGDEQ